MDLYYMLPSAPCRSVLMTAKALGVELNTKVVDLMAGDHLKPEFLKINPQHSIPTLVDNGFVVCESRAIMIYLAENYGKRYVSLYPPCPNKRALINQRLFFDMGTLYQRFSEYFYPQFILKAPPNPEAYKKVEEVFGFFEIFLDGEQYAAGDRLSLADIALVTTVSTIEATGFDVSKYPNVDKWYKLVKEVTPGYEINEKGVAEFRAFLKQRK